MSQMLRTLPPGAELFCEFITPDEEDWLMDNLKNHRIDTENNRHRWHFLQHYNVFSGKIDRPAQALSDEFLQSEFYYRLIQTIGFVPQEVLANEYTPVQGIADHIDSHVFGPVVAIVSCGSNVDMIFRSGSIKRKCMIPQRSLLLLTGEARYCYTHGITKAKSYQHWNGSKYVCIPRSLRISYTFRSIVGIPQETFDEGDDGDK